MQAQIHGDSRHQLMRGEDNTTFLRSRQTVFELYTAVKRSVFQNLDVDELPEIPLSTYRFAVAAHIPAYPEIVLRQIARGHFVNGTEGGFSFAEELLSLLFVVNARHAAGTAHFYAEIFVLDCVRIDIISRRFMQHVRKIRDSLYSAAGAEPRAPDYGRGLLFQAEGTHLLRGELYENAHFGPPRIAADLEGNALPRGFVHDVEMLVPVKMFEILHQHVANLKIMRICGAEFKLPMQGNGRFAQMTADFLAGNRRGLVRFQGEQPLPLVEIVHLRVIRLRNRRRVAPSMFRIKH